jgi:hypothetical protein
MVLSGRPPAAGPASGTKGAAGGGANGGTTGGIGGGANGGTTGGMGGGANGGTTGGIGGGASGPGRAIGMPAMSEIGAHATPAAGSTPAEFSRHSDPPACATPGLNAKATQHIPAPTAATLMLSRSKIATDHHSIHSRADIHSEQRSRMSVISSQRRPSERHRQFIGTRSLSGILCTGLYPKGDVLCSLTLVERQLR